jgi:hypothetical protein
MKENEDIRILTTDPSTKPLPDPVLLYIRSRLTRVSFFMNAAGSDSSYDSDDSDEYAFYLDCNSYQYANKETLVKEWLES